MRPRKNRWVISGQACEAGPAISCYHDEVRLGILQPIRGGVQRGDRRHRAGVPDGPRRVPCSDPEQGPKPMPRNHLGR